MKFQVSDGDKYQKVMEVEIPVEEMDMPIKQACKRMANQVNIPGFRKGKAPRSILENYVGMQAILEEAADDILGQAYTQGLEETGIQPVVRPMVEVVTLAADQPCVFKFTITVRPDVTLGQYKELDITRMIVEISETDVDQDLEQQRQRMCRLEDVLPNVPAEDGNIVDIDFTGYIDGEAFPGGSGKGYPLQLGSKSFIPGFEDQLIGCMVGDEKDVVVTFPEDYQAEELAGKEATFKVKVNLIRTRHFPELNDSFAKLVSETAENFDQLRDEVRARLTEDSMRIANDAARDSAIMAAIENIEVELPPAMVEQEIDSMVDAQAQRLRSQGLTIQQFLEFTNSTMESMREDFRERAELILKRDLMLDEIAKVEDIQATEEEVEEELMEMSRIYLEPLEKVREMMNEDNRMRGLYEAVRRNKAEDLIFDTANFTDEVVDREAMEQQRLEEMMEKAEAADAAADEAEEAAEAVEAAEETQTVEE